MSRYLLLTLFIASFALPARAQLPELINDPQFHPDAKAAVDSIYNFNFEGAEKPLSSWKNRYPGHPIWKLMDGIEFWWKVLSDLENTSYDEEFVQTMKEVDYRAGQLLHEQPRHADGLIIKAISNGYLARHHANRSEWLASMNYGRKAMNAHEYLLEQQPNLPDLMLAEGLKQYYTAHLPEAYPIVKTVSWAMPSGDKTNGLKILREAENEAVFARAEATYFLGNINYNYEENYDVAVQKFEELHQQFPNNNYYVRILVKSYFRQHHRDKALKLIDTTLDRWETQQLPHQKVLLEELLTWKGRILEQQGKKMAALESYQMAFSSSQKLPNPQERSFYVVAGYLVGKILVDQEKTEEAKSYLNKVRRASVEDQYRDRAKALLSEFK